MLKKTSVNMLTLALSTSLVAGFSASFDVDAAHAAEKKRKTLLEALFPTAAKRAAQKRQRQKQRALAQQNEQHRLTAKPIKKVNAARYYKYKSEGFRTLKSAPILSAVVAKVTVIEILEPVQTMPEASAQLPLLPVTSAQETVADVVKKTAVENLQMNDLATRKHLENSLIIKLPLASVNTNNASTDIIVDGQLVEVEEFGSTEPVASKPKRPHVLYVEGLEGFELKGEATLLAQIEKHYSADPSFIWIDENFDPLNRVEAMMNIFETADSYGLNPDDYIVESIFARVAKGASLKQAATQFELALSATALRYMADASSGVINPNKISGYHDFASYKRDYKQHLVELTTAELPAKALLDSHPDNVKYTALKVELDALLVKAKSEQMIEPIAKGTLVKPGETNAELSKIVASIARMGSQELHTKHGAFLQTYTGSELYSEEVVALVKDFQKEKTLTPDGIIGRNTINVMTNVSAKAKIKKIRLAMERLRWLPENFGKRHVFINQPAYNASYVVNGVPKLSMRAIVGKKSNQTNFFYDTIESVVVNPYWNVPRSILVNEKLSRLQANPYYYEQRGYEILRHGGKVADPGSIDWYDEASTKKYYVRQKPGGKNALGEVKILFPNKHNIYMHDTPARGLFKRSSRALSHGCIRLHKPRDMAAAVMGTSVKKISGLIGAGKNRAMAVPNKMPVYVSYFTAFPNSSGEVRFYPDIYGRDAALEKALSTTLKARTDAATS
ncbi:MAG: murein L,D-transpeptidase [Nitratireductor sp.]